MRHTTPLRFLSVLSAMVAAGLMAIGVGGPARAASATPATSAADEAGAACEQAARRTLSAPPGRTSDATFTVKTTVQPRLSTEQQIVLNGEGRWRDAGGLRNVRFTCNVDRQTFETVGFVMRDTDTVVVAKAPPPRQPMAEPDLSNLSVASCESSAALALKRRWPRVSQISFEPDTRSFQQTSDESAELHGEGRALPSQGKPVTFFGFACHIDPQDGRVLRTSVTG